MNCCSAAPNSPPWSATTTCPQSGQSELSDHGLHVPADVSVVGFDDIQGAAFHNPSLTTIRQPLTQMGKVAARILLQRIRGQATFPDVVPILPELVIRESTCPPNPKRLPAPSGVETGMRSDARHSSAQTLTVLHPVFLLTGVLHAIGGPLLPSVASAFHLNDSQSGFLFLLYFAGSSLALCSASGDRSHCRGRFRRDCALLSGGRDRSLADSISSFSASRNKRWSSDVRRQLVCREKLSPAIRVRAGLSQYELECRRSDCSPVGRLYPGTPYLSHGVSSSCCGLSDGCLRLPGDPAVWGAPSNLEAAVGQFFWLCASLVRDLLSPSVDSGSHY